MRLTTRVAGIILKDDEILLMHRVKNGDEYWVFPGGGLEDTDSSPEKGLIRELIEETTLTVTIKKLLYKHDYTTSDGLYYFCDYVSGIPSLGDSIELERMKAGKTDLYEPAWYPTSALSSLLVYPLEIRDLLIKDLNSNFEHEPIVQKYDTKDLRKS